MDNTTEERLKQFDEVWPEPKYEDIGSYYSTMYQIREWKRLRKRAERGYPVDRTLIESIKKRSLRYRDTASIKHADRDTDFLRSVAKSTFYWDFTKDIKHQTTGLRIISAEQLIDAFEYYSGVQCRNKTNAQYVLIDRYFHAYHYGTYDECSKAFREHKKETRKAINYDVKRTGLPDYRGGRDVTAEEIRETFGLKSVTVSSRIAKRSAQALLNVLYDSLCDIADVFQFSNPKLVSISGKLSIDIGGKTGRNANGSFGFGDKTIRISSRNRKSGTFIHEYFHAIEGIREAEIVKVIEKDGAKYTMGNFDACNKILNLFMDTSSKFYQDAASLERPEYWTNTTEMFARAGEVFFEEELKKRGAVNHFLVNTKAYSDPRYPVGEEKEQLCQWYGEMIGQLFPEREA